MTVDELIKNVEGNIMWEKYKPNEYSDMIIKDAQDILSILKEYKYLKSMRDSIVKIINENNAPDAWKYDMIVDEVMEHENFGFGEERNCVTLLLLLPFSASAS